MDKKFDLEEQYQFYLQKVRLDEKKMGEVQKKETRQAFMAGIAQASVYFVSLTEMDEDAAVDGLDDMFKQVSAYWETL